MRDGIYIAELVFGDDRVVSARPSDAVALAVRTGAPIFGAEDLLDEVGIEIPDEQEDEVEKFREFLDQISPEDFGAGSGSGAGEAAAGLAARTSEDRIGSGVSRPAC